MFARHAGGSPLCLPSLGRLRALRLRRKLLQLLKANASDASDPLAQRPWVLLGDGHQHLHGRLRQSAAPAQLQCLHQGVQGTQALRSAVLVDQGPHLRRFATGEWHSPACSGLVATLCSASSRSSDPVRGDAWAMASRPPDRAGACANQLLSCETVP